MGFEHLTDVHARRHAQRIQHDVDRRTVGEIRHVFDRNDRRDDALVAVTAGHLVAGLHAALHREVHLHHLEHARGEIVAGRDLGFLLVEALLERLALDLEALGSLLELAVRIFVFETDLEPRFAGHLVEVRHFDLALEAVRTTGRDLADEHVAHAREQVVFEDALLVAQVLADAFDFSLLDGQRARVLVDAVAREHAHVDDRAVHARGHAQ